MQVIHFKMTTTASSSLLILALLIIITGLLSSKSHGFKESPALRFFQVDNYLFAGNSTHYWHVFSSQADGTNSSSSGGGGAIRFNMVGPHLLLAEKEEEAASDAPQTEDHLKFLFVASLREDCSLLVFVDSALHYRLWRIRLNSNLAEAIATFKAPFRLTKLSSPDGSCGQQANFKLPPETGHLSALPFLSGVLNKEDTRTSLVLVSSVFSSEHNSVLHVLFSRPGDSASHYASVHLNQSAGHQWVSSPASAITAPTTSKLLEGRSATLYSREGARKKFMLLQDDTRGTRVCLVTSLAPSLVLKSTCKSITTYYSLDKQTLQQMKLGRGVELGDDHRHSNGTAPAEKVCNDAANDSLS